MTPRYCAPPSSATHAADSPKVEEFVAVMRTAADGAHGRRLRGLIVIMWRAGLRIQEALALTEGDLDQRRASLLVRRGKGGRRRHVGLDAWGCEHPLPWLQLWRELPVGPLLCVIIGATRGRHWSPATGRAELRRTAAAGVRRRFAPAALIDGNARPLLLAHRDSPGRRCQRPPAECRGSSDAEAGQCGRAVTR
jgi:integrase